MVWSATPVLLLCVLWLFVVSSHAKSQLHYLCLIMIMIMNNSSKNHEAWLRMVCSPILSYICALVLGCYGSRMLFRQLPGARGERFTVRSGTRRPSSTFRYSRIWGDLGSSQYAARRTTEATAFVGVGALPKIPISEHHEHDSGSSIRAANK